MFHQAQQYSVQSTKNNIDETDQKIIRMNDTLLVGKIIMILAQRKHQANAT